MGRDKLLRTLQFFSRFYAWYLFRTNNPARVIAPFEAIQKQFGLTRKALRLGKNVEHFKAAALAADNKSLDPVLKYCAIGRQLGYGTYLSLDAITYVGLVVFACTFRERRSDAETAAFRWHSASCKCKKATEGSLQSLVYGLDIQRNFWPVHPVAAETEGAEH